MRSLVCQWQRVVQPGVPLHYVTVDQDTGVVYGAYNNTIVKLDYNIAQVLLFHELSEDMEVSDIHWLPSQRALFLVLNSTTLALFYPHDKSLEELVEIEDGVGAVKWAPDDGVCVIVTEAGKLMLMSEEFDCIKHLELRPEGFGSEHHTQVGWGSKDTQFHGSEGKSAAQRPTFATPTPISVQDTRDPKISWRGDGQYFVVSTVDKKGDQEYRVIRVWTRDGEHTATNEPVPGLEESLCWKPSGNLITSSVIANNQHQVIFMERNGLRHGEFRLTLAETNTVVSDTYWNCNSNILAVVYEGQSRSHVTLYTVSNYDWQLKQHYVYDNPITFLWDPEDEFKFHVASGPRYICHQLASHVLKCSDTTTTLVITDKQVMTTPMSQKCVPPPMSHCQLVTDSTCNLISCHGDSVWTLCNNRTICKFNAVPNSGEGLRYPDETFEIEKEFPLPPHAILRHLIMISPNKAFCIALVNDVDALLTLEISDKEVFVVSCTTLEDTVVNMVQHKDSDTIAVQLFSGELFQLTDGILEPWGNPTMRECVQFTEMDIAVFSDEVVVVGRTNLNHLYMDTRLWSYDCTSFTLHRTHILITSHTHTLRCVPLNQTAHIARTTEGVVDTGIRTLERGSRLVVANPVTSRVVLQMPRGNLEVIHPRPLLLSYLSDLINNCQYDKVFVEVRKHRVNMNFVYDYHPEQFLNHLTESVLEQVPSSHVELFVAELSEDDTTMSMYSFMGAVSTGPSNKVHKVCNALIRACNTAHVIKWLNTVIACYVKIEDIPAGLLCLKELYTTHTTQTESAIKYMLILTDDDLLFNHALSTYDLDLVLMVAQHTQKDPKEYLQFLKDLKSLDENYRKFKIDEHLNKNKEALESLMKCENRFSEVCDFVTKHSLHSLALSHYRFGSTEYKTVGSMLANKLQEKGHMEEAGVMFGQCEMLKECLQCLRHTTQSSLALSIAAQLNLSKDQISAIAEQLAENLKRDSKYCEAAHLYERYCDNTDEAVDVLCEGAFYSQALEYCQMRKRVDLVSNIMSSLKTQCETTIELLVEKIENVKKYTERIKLVRDKRALVGTGFEDMDHSDLYSDTTSITATSNVSSTSSRRSAKSSKGRRKLERKKFSLKEGSRYEYFAIQEAYKGIIKFLHEQRRQISDMVNILLLQGYRDLARKLLDTQEEAVLAANQNKEDIWPKPKSDTVEEDEGDELGEKEEEEPVSFPPDIVLSKWQLVQFSGC